MRVRVRLLPLTIFAAVLMLSVRVSDVWRQVEIGVGEESAAQATPTGTKAAAGNAATGEETDKTESKAETKSTTKAGQQETGKKGSTKAGGAKPTSSVAARSPAKPEQNETKEEFDPGDLSDAEVTVLRELSARREELDRRERNIEIRSGLLKAAEKRVEEKIAELKAIQETIQAEMKKKDEKQEAKMRSLVKIYEKMKPKDAARIFGQLDIDILLDVIDRMKEAKSAPILAAMSSSRAKEVTVELARRVDSNVAFGGQVAKADSRRAKSAKAKPAKR